MNKSGIRSFFITLFLVISSFFNIGSSSFVVGGEAKQENITINEGSKAVCYNARTQIRYTTIEKALSEAKDETAYNDTIYVIPGTNPTITSDCEIASGDTLCLPYVDDGVSTHTFLYRNDTTSEATFGDLDSSKVATNRKNLLTILSNVTIVNNGTITVGGSIGYGGSAQGLTGQVASSYCEILMQESSKISNNGTLNIYGYIKENSKNNGCTIENSSGSNVKMPFVIYDFRGGSYSYACYNENVMPFNNYDFPNCQVLQKYNTGAKMTGMVSIYAGNKWSTPDVLVLGTQSDSCLFKLSSGYVTIKYNPYNALYTTNDLKSSTTEETANNTEIHSYGNISIASLKISLNVGSTITIDTSKMVCSLCYKFKIFIDSGTLSIDNKIKFLGGSLLKVESNAILSCNSSVVFYQNYIPAIETGGLNLYPATLKSAKLIVDGTTNINSSFGGLVETSSNTGRINLLSGFSNSVSTLEILKSTGSFLAASADKTDTHSESAKAYLGDSSKPSAPSILPGQSSYESKGDYWYLPLSDITSVSIDPSSGKTASNTEGRFELTALISPAQNSSSNISYAWSCPEGGTFNSTTEQTVTFTTPANSGTSSNIIYNVTCKVTFTKSDGSEDYVEASGAYTATKADSGGGTPCFEKGTLVTTNRGLVPVENLKPDDLIKSYNHEIGKYEYKPIAALIDHGEDKYNVISLDFSDGSNIGFITSHGLFDLDENEYVDINEENYLDYIGHRFAKSLGDEYDEVTLVKATIVEKFTHSYTVLSSENINCEANGLLNITSVLEGIYNIFEYDLNHNFDSVLMQQDIEKYGLYTYDDFKDRIDEKKFNDLGFKYFKVSIGKGLLTDDILQFYIDWFYECINNGEAIIY